ncbi:hypothetical protein [Dactylosporangium sp. CA-092794]|uniref:hypothetical protein n=1 Tax=Dactylosporangium sp. CA-092794 TaxID=3239929 RepID=UPI003D8A3FB6
MTRLLNATVTDGATIRSRTTDPGVVALGTGPGRHGAPGRPVPIAAQGGTRLWLGVSAFLFADDDGHLTVLKSTWGLLTGRNADTDVLHYDYERGKDGYPEAHLQVYGRNADLEEVLESVGRKRARLHQLHLPVGGRRFRPALEDLIEFLIDERLVEAKPGSKQALERSRGAYHDVQLLAAIRRRPAKAAEGLAMLAAVR